MRDFELDDRFWREALTAVREGSRASALSGSYPDYAQLLTEIEADATRDAMLVGARLTGGGHNPQLLSFVSAAFLARAGLRTLLVDLSPEFRWLERLLGRDLKEGMIDHLQYGVPLEQCVRNTAIPNMDVLTSGASLLGGSALDDGPAFRAALDRLRQHYKVLVVTLPGSNGDADAAGVLAICDAVFAIEAEKSSTDLIGSERWIVRLGGDPQAADELGQLIHRFLGPLPDVLVGAKRGTGSLPPAGPPDHIFALANNNGLPHSDSLPVDDAWLDDVELDDDGPLTDSDQPLKDAPPGSDADDLAFLNTLEGDPVPEDLEPEAQIDDRLKAVRAKMARSRLLPVVRVTPPRRRWLGLAVASGFVVLVGVLAGRMMAPVISGWLGDGGDSAEQLVARLDVEGGTTQGTDPTAEPGELVPLVDPAGPTGSTEEPVVEKPPAEPTAKPTPSSAAPSPTPYSIHAGSYQDNRSARRVAGRIEAAGFTAFVTPVDIPDRGRWYRVFAGTFADSVGARTARETLLRRDVVDDALVQSTPLAFDLGIFDSRDQANVRKRDLASRGISAYVVGAGPYRVYAGAFRNQDEARVLRRALEEAAEPISMIKRQ
jgi:cell division septation protein DedD